MEQIRMSVLFGTHNFDGFVSDGHVQRVSSELKNQPLDRESTFCEQDTALLYRGLSTFKESHGEIQPHVTQSGAILTWDGRLDNREQIISQLESESLSGRDDLAIVAAAYERWGTDCFSKLLGDWALVICDRKNHSVLLAKDFIGARPLYYFIEEGRTVWSTLLDLLVAFAGHPFDLEAEFIAGLLAFYPATHLTPLSGIRSVPPACFVSLAKGRHRISRYWNFDPTYKLRYRTDAEYEEHFRVIFRESLRRRLRADAPILAELSGGIDSSAIVCVADAIMRDGAAETPRLDTVSYYDDSEPDWDERPYFAQVEKQRGRAGFHLNVAAGRRTDGCDRLNYRVLLSGIGGDEVTGGIPDPSPELADLLSRARFRTFARQLTAWALSKRKPWSHLLFETVRDFLPLAWVDVPQRLQPAAWLNLAFRKSYATVLRGYPQRLRLLGPLPSFQDNLHTLEMLRRQLSCAPSGQLVNREKRYPFLDRDLLEFLFAIPREQLLRPGDRRSLVRRALAGIVPAEVLQRKRKAFASRQPIVEIAKQQASLSESAEPMCCLSLGLVDGPSLWQEVAKAADGQVARTATLVRLFSLEAWLGQMKMSGAWSGALGKNCPRVPVPMEISAEKN
jgi:asparagine synthase (glutamine-hydrolysing)